MFKFGVVVAVFLTVHAIWGDAFAADPVIRSVELKSFGGNISGIRALYNSSWPVAGKCCPIGQLFNPNITEAEKQCEEPRAGEKMEFSPFFHPFNRTGAFAPSVQSTQFVAVVGNPCQDGVFKLQPEEDSDDEFYLLTNGSIYVPHGKPMMMEPGRDYCLEVLPGEGIAVLVCLPELKVVTADTRLAFYAVGLLTSVPFLLATILCYLIVRKLRDIYGIALCCYCGCLAVAFLSLAILQLGGHLLGNNGCDGIAFVIQFSFIACFFWLNLMTFEMWQLVKRYAVIGSAIRDERPGSSRIFFYYSLWGWGLPAVLIILSLVKNLRPIIPWTYVKRSGNELPSCWSGLDKSALPYFYVPAGLLVTGNVFLFVITLIRITRIQPDLDSRQLARNGDSDREDRRVFRELKRRFGVTIVLSVIMGVNCAMELVSVWMDSDPLAWSIFDLVNALQGVLVFGMFVLRKTARTLIWQRVKELTGTNAQVQDPYADNERGNEMTLLPVLNNNKRALNGQ